MKLNKGTTAYKLYATCYIIAKKLFGKENTWLISNNEVDVPINTNFCPVVRNIFIWTPIYLVLLLGLAVGMTYTVFILPATFGGFMGYVNTYLIPGGAIGLIALIAWGITTWHNKYEKNKESLEDKEARHEAGNYTLRETGVQYVTALHDKTCPLITVVDEPVVVEPDPAPDPDPDPAPTDAVDDVEEDKSPTDGALSEEMETAVDSIIESLDAKVPVVEPASSIVNPSIVNLFLAKWLPSFWPLLGFIVATAVVVFINLGMANLMEHEPVVFQTAECVASYDVETSYGTIACGEYKMTVSNLTTLNFVNDTVILKKKPYCFVEKGTYTEDTTFYCEYK